MTTARVEPERKLYLGGRIKRLRYDLGLSQTRMAEDVGVSPSYLNHMERNQRPVTAQVLLKLAQAYDLDLRHFAKDDSPADTQSLTEILADPLFADLKVPRRDLAEVSANQPVLAEAVVRLYRAFDEGRRRAALGQSATEADAPVSSADWVRDQLNARHNYLPELDSLGEALFAALGGDSHGLIEAARRRLSQDHGIDVRILPASVMMIYQRRFDPHRRRLILSETLRDSSRAFAIAYQLGLSEYGREIQALCDKVVAPDPAAARLFKIALLNALAAAILMPYGRFQAQAEACGYDIELLRAPFGVSFEQAAQRLTSLSRPGLRGVPFFLMRVDRAGNVSKRLAAEAFPFSRFGGVCPRWNIHQAFQTPGHLMTQIIEVAAPDGTRTLYFTVSRTLETGLKPYDDGVLSQQAIGLGCELKHAHRLVYARGLDLTHPAAVETGPVCRLCERPNCRERTAPPVARVLVVDEWVKGISPFSF